ncbi:metalloregulator ArsR/SmtB family transcription factor [Streptomyces sp. NPDC001985]|uniref:ArsR/SmtB family transcription factor n=1 Tax=Streptomyces sp. NPDC001985 TaxID=3154406 RepID=UPI003326F394
MTEEPIAATERSGADGTAEAAVSAVLSALADPTRRRILDALAARGRATATVLAGEMPVSRQAVVKHLAVLAAAGLVSGRREGRETLYTVLPAPLGVTARWMERVASDWDSRLAAVKRLAEAERERDSPAGAPGGRDDRG